ncbi:MAG TPA: GNAT family N-acetyltransferase [Ignavibacteria bacterium]|nr:GNAT family N-acetyltransferase [Ignavibacteria bacterium]HMR40397.1 GNAT family N-acetyltransferase [Ignavibacteria bacterium]
MIRNLTDTDREKIKDILIDTDNFNEEEIKIALELIDVYLNEKDQKDYEIFVDSEEENGNEIKGYVCIGPRPLTEGTYDLYWIAVNPKVQSKGIGSGLIKHIEDHIRSKNGRLILIETSGKDSYEKERKFYEKNNYQELVNIRDFYRSGDGLVIYGKYL